MAAAFPMPSSRAESELDLRKQMPQLQTASLSRTNTARSKPQPSSKKSSGDTMPHDESARSPTMPPSHQRFVMTDHVAARYLEDDPKTTMLARRQQIEGYEIYLVEQWACSTRYIS
jgi:hypothetical protein